MRLVRHVTYPTSRKKYLLSFKRSFEQSPQSAHSISIRFSCADRSFRFRLPRNDLFEPCSSSVRPITSQMSNLSETARKRKSLSRRPTCLHLPHCLPEQGCIRREEAHRRKTGQDNGGSSDLCNGPPETATANRQTGARWVRCLLQPPAGMVLFSRQCRARGSRTGNLNDLAAGTGISLRTRRRGALPLFDLQWLSQADSRTPAGQANDCPRCRTRFDAGTVCGAFARRA